MIVDDTTAHQRPNDVTKSRLILYRFYLCMDCKIIVKFFYFHNATLAKYFKYLKFNNQQSRYISQEIHKWNMIFK